MEEEEDEEEQSLSQLESTIDPSSVLVSVYNDPPLHPDASPGNVASTNAMLDRITNSTSDSTSCHVHNHKNSLCHCKTVSVGPTSIAHLKDDSNQNHSLEPIATLIDNPASWTSLKRRRLSSEGDANFVLEKESESQKEKRMRMDSTYECGYYSRVTEYSSEIVNSLSYEEQVLSRDHQPLHLLASAIPSSALAVEDFQAQSDSLVPSIHSITGRLPESDAPRNLASMLTPLKCVAPTIPANPHPGLLPSCNSPSLSGGGIYHTKNNSSDFPVSTVTQNRLQSGEDRDQTDQESSAQISSLVSRFSSSFSGLASQQQQQLSQAQLKSLASSELGQQQGNGTDTSVSICSALIKESFDVLSRPSLLAMSV